jgi:hypothetical protein
MYTRNVTLKLKSSSIAEFTRLIESEIIPMLRKQTGFREEITFIAPERSEALAISFWDTKANAEAYARTAYADVLKTLAKVVDGTPKVGAFEVVNSTFQKIAAQGV